MTLKFKTDDGRIATLRFEKPSKKYIDGIVIDVEGDEAESEALSYDCHLFARSVELKNGNKTASFDARGTILDFVKHKGYEIVECNLHEGKVIP